MPDTSMARDQLIRRGAVDAVNIPGFALGSTMTGFAVIAKEAGFDFWMIVATTASVWGLPGQVAFASLYATGASLMLIFVAVALANMRMMLMVTLRSQQPVECPGWKCFMTMEMIPDPADWAGKNTYRDILSTGISFSI